MTRCFAFGFGSVAVFYVSVFAVSTGTSEVVLDQDTQRNAFWLVLCNKKPPKNMAPLGVLGGCF